MLCAPLIAMLSITTSALGFSALTIACWLTVIVVTGSCGWLAISAIRRGTADLVDVLDTALSRTIFRRD